MPKKQQTVNMQRLAEIEEHIMINGEPDATPSDALEYAMGECGMTKEGVCMLAGTEQCDFECPFRE